jgi:hypothetical protein
MVYELIGFNTDSRYRDDVRWREYTTSEKRADEFGQIRKVQFSDSGHGIVFSAVPLKPGQRRKPIRRALMSHVPDELRRIKRESKWPADVRQLVAAARQVAARAGEPDPGLADSERKFERFDPVEVEARSYAALHAAVAELG